MAEGLSPINYVRTFFLGAVSYTHLDELYKLNVTVPVGVPDDPETVALTLAVEHEGELGVKLRVGVLVAIENGSAELDAIGEYVPLPL